MWQKICAAPPPHLNKIQKQFFSQESVRYEFSEQESWAEKKNCTGEIWQWQWLLFSLSPLTFIWVAGQRAALVMFNKSNVSKTTLILNPSLSQTSLHWNISWPPRPKPLTTLTSCVVWAQLWGKVLCCHIICMDGCYYEIFFLTIYHVTVDIWYLKLIQKEIALTTE